MNSTSINWETGELSITALVSMEIEEAGGSSLRTFSLKKLDKIHAKKNKKLSELFYKIFNSAVNQCFKIEYLKNAIILHSKPNQAPYFIRSYDIEEIINPDNRKTIIHLILKKYLEYNFYQFTGESLFQYFEKIIEYQRSYSAFKYYQR